MNRVAVIAGASDAGAAAAVRLARGGFDVALVDTDPTGFGETARQVSETGRQCLALEADCADTTSFERAIRAIGSGLGSPAVLVTGVPLGVRAERSPFLEHHVGTVRRRLRTLFVCSRATTTPMARRKWGRVINVGLATETGADGWRDAQTVLAGLIGFTRTLAVELAAFGITANYVAPLACAPNPRPRLRTAGDDAEPYAAGVAHVAEFLADDRASAITGQGTYVAGRPDRPRLQTSNGKRDSHVSH
ncbi:3-oxoacyl-[acyl-carrier protein] reductase [Amycolatopsis tolypomycina]|uniref:3-oxoacyl-[acyl-carrier protein] reductase n=1 Tax=Amycolatopsis tolypomycina TaxID=208445 RepID=A0A1H4TZI0_9PSEU|nr:SDR family oxidoreductase [Amycolatopsis tolypomycina]SEC61414.1 3-oxoacyl-[acyl-carrier protein] reductase [Amycolatopsis tolypomycina]